MGQSVSPQIAAIRARYQASLPEKIAALEEQIEVLSKAPVQPDCIKYTHEVLHKLAGSSGMYGYDDVSLASRNAMASAADENVETLLTQLDELKQLIEQHI